MKKRYINSLFFLAIVFLCFTCPVQALADSVTLDFETQALDLDTGTVTEQAPGILDGSTGADILIGYHADRIPHAVLVTADEDVTMAIMNNTNYNSVTAADVAGLSFSAEVIDQPLESSDVVVIKTDGGATFKLGNAVESDTGVNFSYAFLQ
jgi:hypothetical protein